MRQFALLAVWTVWLTAQVAVAHGHLVRDVHAVAAQSAVLCSVGNRDAAVAAVRGERRGPLVHTRSVLPTAGP